MNLTLRRNDFTPDGIFGELLAESGEVLAATLEHSYECEPKMPSGDYSCIRRLSPHFGYDVFLISGVPEHDFIEIHIGNLQQDSEGCVLLGLRRDGVAIRGSKLAFQAFMKRMEGVDEFTLTVA